MFGAIGNTIDLEAIGWCLAEGLRRKRAELAGRVRAAGLERAGHLENIAIGLDLYWRS
jgi:hypothetical protein